MSDNPYESANRGRLCFKGGALASRSSGIDKKSKKKKKDKKKLSEEIGEEQKPQGEVIASGDGSGEGIYTIDAAKKMKYEDLFPVETKKFGYDPEAIESNSVEQALNERVKKKADRLYASQRAKCYRKGSRGFLEMHKLLCQILRKSLSIGNRHIAVTQAAIEERFEFCLGFVALVFWLFIIAATQFGPMVLSMKFT